ncbi:hypothetical protein [Tautonia plasticadhaerens]|uniref:DUF1772 domain-containing protein n=1 Tax=Tautonia plasticadhaerens TaxID=2527974 RepID=A0A518GXI9_9BACT|nr:hypothetical protein [Tautonia plasticadhaerens]QDV33283.1 hypothetical protein ElP_11260 [Tautonia plasticadhaerens]
MSTLALLLCLGSTLSMAGLIWFVQVVHYPLLGEVGPGSFGRYHAEHVRRTGPVVGPAMIGELASAAWLVVDPPQGCPGWLAVAGLSAATLAWISTAAVQVPLHRRLASGFDAGAHRRLVRTNWARTVSWSAHALIVLTMAGLAMG